MLDRLTDFGFSVLGTSLSKGPVHLTFFCRTEIPNSVNPSQITTTYINVSYHSTYIIISIHSQLFSDMIRQRARAFVNFFHNKRKKTNKWSQNNHGDAPDSSTEYLRMETFVSQNHHHSTINEKFLIVIYLSI